MFSAIYVVWFFFCNTLQVYCYNANKVIIKIMSMLDIAEKSSYEIKWDELYVACYVSAMSNMLIISIITSFALFCSCSTLQNNSKKKYVSAVSALSSNFILPNIPYAGHCRKIIFWNQMRSTPRWMLFFRNVQHVYSFYAFL